ncbi:voltage-dependent calcium channel gamma-7 subunit-like [Macrosteles quadrilineatus]|uniref:voltage-dependent calcium channel gamma-7 subunit-like n=1 Tax=Macrosteles quadrilineatus TaxID=74068 RepID=UPI0023E335B5|nr:voltage-dependent calcium channel gamma-7 subunit-like [Macrosteles quadrilineatus]XP_054258365.1 voltage-dependent calcium channel gamma-7 subunit-like [Macrosteles quadrilineatus]
MCCSSSSGSLSRLGITLGLLSLVTLVTAFVSNVWVYTQEPVIVPVTHASTTITFRIGFWRACPSVSRVNITGHVPSPACQLIKYSPWDELYSSDLGVVWTPLEFTPTFVSRMRFSMPFAAVSLILTLLAAMFALMGHCNTDHKTLVACGLFTLAGLTLASGLVVFVSVLSDAYQDRPRRPGATSPFHYQYGWSFVTAGAAFVLAEGAALLSMTSYLKRFATVEDMVRTMVPGADRRLQERQLCKEYLVKRSSSVLNPDMLHKGEALDTSEEGCDGPLLTSKTPPDICSTNTILQEPTTVPITLMHKRPQFPGQPIAFQFPTTDFPRYATIGSCTIVHQGVLGVSEGTSSSSGSSASSAGVVTSSGSSASSRKFQSLPRARKMSTPSGFSTLNTKRSGSPSSLSQGYCSGGTGCQPIVIHSDEEIV